MKFKLHSIDPSIQDDNTEMEMVISQISNFGLFAQPTNVEYQDHVPHFLIFKDPHHNNDVWILLEEDSYGAKVINDKLTLKGLKEAIQLLCKNYQCEVQDWFWLYNQIWKSWEIET